MGRSTSKPKPEPWSAEDSLRATMLRDAAEQGLLTWEIPGLAGRSGERRCLLYASPEDTEPRPLTAEEAAVLERLVDEGHMVIVRGAHSDRGAVENLQS